jgi:hypothetical protein
MGIKLSNNANATLAAGITSSATSITLTTGQGARFPSLSGGDYFYATLVDTSNNLEIVKCTARSTDVLTVIRAQESTTARAYNTGDRIEIRLTAQTFIDAVNEIGPTQISDEANSSTGYLALPSGTTAQRPASPNGSMIRKNTTTGYIEYYDTASSSWIGLGAFQATGGTIVSSGGYTYHTFTSSGTFNVSAGAKSIETLVIAGGGGGSNGDNGNDAGGGGGAGGVVYGTQTATAGLYTVVVGAGGAAVSGTFRVAGNPGSNSSFPNLATAIGGGRGGQCNSAGGSGGSGGGAGGGGGGPFAGGAATSGQGNVGGTNSGVIPYTGAGGGGAGSAGGNSGGGLPGGNGGSGTSSYSTWASATSTGSGGNYAGGGAGGGGISPATGPGTGGSGGGGNGGAAANSGSGGNGVNAVANTGSGGGGAGNLSATSGSGASGIVIIRYLS